LASLQTYSDQVRLLVDVLPVVARQRCFALKGGTALNLFLRNMPRLSVDIDLAYLPVSDRETSLKDIDTSLRVIASDIGKTFPNAHVVSATTPGTEQWIKLVVQRGNASIKIEVTPVLRGSVFESEWRETTSDVQAEYGYVRMQLLSFEDLYAGKLCAALDRQHPRDLFDVRLLLQEEGITERMKDAFLVYVLSHPRPMSELLAPRPKEIRQIYQNEFVGMTREMVPLEELLEVRETMTRQLHALMSVEDREFLLSVKRGDANWQDFAIPHAVNLPAVRWKLHNLAQMHAAKRSEALRRLEAVLFPAS